MTFVRAGQRPVRVQSACKGICFTFTAVGKLQGNGLDDDRACQRLGAFIPSSRLIPVREVPFASVSGSLRHFLSNRSLLCSRSRCLDVGRPNGNWNSAVGSDFKRNGTERYVHNYRLRRSASLETAIRVENPTVDAGNDYGEGGGTRRGISAALTIVTNPPRATFIL